MAATHRLPANVKPTHYDLVVLTDLTQSKYFGTVTINLDILTEGTFIAFNVTELILKDAILISPSSTELFTGSSFQIDREREWDLDDTMLGFYRSSWINEGKEQYYALTQFEPISARKAFPCWDEPQLKAIFSITMISRENTVNLSNMSVASEETYVPVKGATDDLAWVSRILEEDGLQCEDKWKITKFQTTPPMSTYLVAYANGPFTFIESCYKSPLSGKVKPLRFYGTPDLTFQGQYSLDVVQKVLPIYEEIFQIEYPLPKLDTLVASAFDAGAMENWGLIAGKAKALLLDPNQRNLNTMKNIATGQSHEVAHMWFGNITTMAWWDNLYLNEGFASLMGEVIVLSEIYPEWKVDAAFISTALDRALCLDAKLSSHPIETPVPDAHMIHQMFDVLSYKKAASVLRMLSNFVGEDLFLKGVSTYLKAHLYDNSVTEDLWNAISEVTGLDITFVMDNWVKKMGFPVITVTETEHGILIRQDRFLETGIAESKDNETIWAVPLFFLTVSQDGKPLIDKQLILDSREKFINLDVSKSYKLNAGTFGVYRVMYPTERLTKIALESAQEHSPFSFQDRIGLILDARALAKAGLIPTSNVLTLINAIAKSEKEGLVWSTIADTLEDLTSTWFEQQDIVDSLNDFRGRLFGPLVDSLGYEYAENELAEMTEIRTKAISVAAEAGDKTVINELLMRFRASLNNVEGSTADLKLPPDLVRPACIVAGRYGNREDFEALKALTLETNSPSKAWSAMHGTTAVQNINLAQETFDHILTNAREQDFVYYFHGFYLNYRTRQFFSDAFMQNFDIIAKKFEGNFAIRMLIDFAHGGLSRKEDHQKIEAFYKTKDTSKFNMVLKQSLDSILAKHVWIKRSTSDIRDWLLAT
ncbi:Aminopeptidase [Abortiporus biennis]